MAPFRTDSDATERRRQLLNAHQARLVYVKEPGYAANVERLPLALSEGPVAQK